MNKWQKNVLGNRTEADERILKRLKKIYQQAEKDIDDNIAVLMGRTDTENLQSITYQVEYQKALKSQINSILGSLNSNQFTDVSQYLTESYEDGFVGAVYDLHGQGIPLVFPIDQEQAVRSLKNNSKLSKGLWGSLAQGNSKLQNNLRTEISRGFSQGHSYAQIAKSVSNQMNIGFNKVSRIVRTESHRISNEAAMDAAYKAKEAGADVVKQWDSTLDKRTRPHHSQLDGQIRELDEPFEVAGHTAMYPGGFGVASEDIHCRCAVLQRAKWASNEDELQTLKDRAEYFGLDKTDSFKDFKKKYLKSVENSENSGIMLSRKVGRKASNTGAFSSLSVPMQKRAVKRVCEKYGIDTTGLTLKIQRSEHLLTTSYYGSTDYDNVGRIDLFPNAFINEEQLVRTMIHEKCHVQQLKEHGKKYCQLHLLEMEEEAYRAEDIWIDKMIKGAE